MRIVVEPLWLTPIVEGLLVTLLLWQYKSRTSMVLIFAIWATALRAIWELSGVPPVILFTNGKTQPIFVPEFHYVQSWKALFWLLVAIPVALLPRRISHWIGLGIFFLTSGVTACFLVFGPDKLAVIPTTGFQTSGLIYNPSMGAALIVITAPFTAILKRRSQVICWAWVFLVVALTLSPDNPHFTSVYVLVVIGLARLFLWKKWPAIAIGASALLAAIGALLYFKKYDGHGRFSEYLFFWHAWLRFWSPWWGMGVAKFEVYGHEMQTAFEGKTKEVFYFLHSDWGELLYQLGILGAIPWLAVCGETAVRAYKADRTLFMVSIGIAAMGVGYFPLHCSASIVVAFLCLSVLKKESLN